MNDDINNVVFNDDCLERMKSFKDESFNMILCDLPYGKIRCHWDKVIPLNLLWEQYERIIKSNGAICLFGAQPFTSELVMSNKKMFRYELIYEKSFPSKFLLANKMPLCSHENILIFYKNLPKYNPQKWKVSERFIDRRKGLNPSTHRKGTQYEGFTKIRKPSGDIRFPFSIISCSSEWSKNMHPTQKPVALCEYLIKTYTDENDIVLDNCAGSGTTAIACINTNRKYVLIEKEKEYYDKILDRIKERNRVPRLF